MTTLRESNLKNRQFFFNSMSNIRHFDLNLLGINQILFKSTDCVIYDTGYFKNLGGANSLYLVFNNVDACIEKSNENKYLIFLLTDKNKEALENYTDKTFG